MRQFGCKIVGIDLGTTNTLLAYFDGILKKGVCCTNSDGSPLTASAVTFFSEDNVLVGNGAKDSAVAYPDITATLFKRKMGIETDGITVNGITYSPQQLSALVLKSVTNDAEEELGEKITDAVITVPAYFGTNRRRATMEAGMLAGLNVRGILDEPVAAIYNADSIGKLEGKNCLVVDLGGGTLDIVVAHVTEESINELFIDGDLNLGGSDWDAAFREYIRKEYLAGKQLEIDEEQELIIKTEMAKKRLSDKTETKFSISTREGRFEISLTRNEFEKCTAGLLDRVRLVLERVRQMMSKKTDNREIDLIILAGGATRMPQIRVLLDELFPGKNVSAKDVDCAVAKGAAVYARMLQAEEQPAIVKMFDNPETKKLKRIVGRSYGISAYIAGTEEEKVWNMIYKNSGLPDEGGHVFQTRYANQKTVLLEIYENNENAYKAEVEDSTLIGKLVLEINGDLPVGTPIYTSLNLDENGMLHAKGYEKTGNTEIETYIQTNALLEEGDLIAEQEQIAAMLQVV